MYTNLYVNYICICKYTYTYKLISTNTHISQVWMFYLITHAVRFSIQRLSVYLAVLTHTQCRSQVVLCSPCSAVDCVRLGIMLPVRTLKGLGCRLHGEMI